MLDENKLNELKEDVSDVENNIDDSLKRKIEETTADIEENVASIECLLNELCQCPNCLSPASKREIIALENQCSNCVSSGSGTGGTILNNTDYKEDPNDFFIEENRETLEGIISSVGIGIRRAAYAVKDIIESIFRFIVNIFKSIYKFFKNVWKSIFGKYEKLLVKIQRLKDKAKKISSSDDEQNFKVDKNVNKNLSNKHVKKGFFKIQRKDFINYKGHVDEETLLLGLKVFSEFLDEFSTNYNKWLKSEGPIRKTVKAFYKDSSSSIFSRLFHSEVKPVLGPEFKSFENNDIKKYSVTEKLKDLSSKQNIFKTTKEFFNGRCIGIVYPDFDKIKDPKDVTKIIESAAGTCQLKSYKENKQDEYPLLRKPIIDAYCDILIKDVKNVIDIEDGLDSINKIEQEILKLNRDLLNKAKNNKANYSIKEDLHFLLNQIRSYSKFITQIPTAVFDHTDRVIVSFVYLIEESIDRRLKQIKEFDKG